MVGQHQGGEPSRRVDWLELFGTATTFVMLNLLWLFGALLFVTIPALTAALLACMVPWSRGEPLFSPLATFWQALRRYWVRATLIAGLDLVLASFILLNLLILRQMGLNQLLPLAAAVLNLTGLALLAVANIFGWALLVTQDAPLRVVLLNGARLAIRHPLWGLLLTSLIGGILLLTAILPRFFMLTVSFAACAYIVQWGAWHIIRRYITGDDQPQRGV